MFEKLLALLDRMSSVMVTHDRTTRLWVLIAESEGSPPFHVEGVTPGEVLTKFVQERGAA
jgi:hypothetical protein